tara:strand:- start:580 stop:2370 length:1791 start_codon:yes stop_codon:yes gene_type:complete
MESISQVYNYIEIAIDSPRHRGLLIPKKDIGKHVNGKPLYRSIYLYNKDAVDFADSKGNSLRDYYGIRDIDNIIIDIDRGDNSDNHTLEKCKAVLHDLVEELYLTEDNFRIYFSGSGYHIHIPNSVFNFSANEELPFQVKETITKLVPNADPMIYMRTGLYRVPHTINKKTNLYKVPLTYSELMTWNPKEIQKIAKTPRFDFVYTELMGDGELSEYKIEKIPRIRQLGTVVEPKKVATCIQTMYNIGPQEGTRHNTMLRIISHFRRNGLPSTAAKAAMLAWNNNQLNEQEVTDQVEYSYNKGYKYGCQDNLMHQYCNPKCIYYKRKDYSIDVLNTTDMQKELQERLNTDFTGKAFNLGYAFGIREECILYPGDLVTIFGPTGSSKTTLAHNIALGYNHHTDSIDPKLQIPTLYLSLELAAWYMHRRSLQIISCSDKEAINNNYEAIYNAHKHNLDHLSLQTVAPTLEQIQQKITELQPAMVVVDYIDLVDVPAHIRGEYEQIKYISHGLSQMAVQNDIIIIQVSQVSREYSRNEVLDLYAGKGSGAIENASRKVIGLNGGAHSKSKTIQLFKNSDGELFTTYVEWTPSFRLRRKDV